MYVLVYVGVLHDDESVQLAYQNRIVPLPDVWWQPDAHADANTNSDAYSNANTDTNSDAYANTNTNANSDTDADTCACAECAEQSGWKCCKPDSDQSVVDR